MTRLLETYLKLVLEEPRGTALQGIVEREIPRELGAYDADGKLVPVRELLLSEGIESSLIQAEMYSTVLQGARQAQCFRQAIPTFQMKSKQLTFPYGSTGAYANKTGEGAEARIGNQDYATLTFTAEKYTVRPVISDEMIADSLYDAMALEIEYAGTALENSLNQVMLTELLDGAGNEYDCDVGGTPTIADAGVKAVANAIGLIKADGFLPDTLILSPQAEALIMAEFVPTGYVGAEAAMSGRLPTMLGLRTFACGVADASTSYAWEYDSDGDIGMLVYDSKKAGGIGMRQDVTVKTQPDIARGLQDIVVSARFDCDSAFANAISRVEY